MVVLLLDVWFHPSMVLNVKIRSRRVVLRHPLRCLTHGIHHLLQGLRVRRHLRYWLPRNKIWRIHALHNYRWLLSNRLMIPLIRHILHTHCRVEVLQISHSHLMFWTGQLWRSNKTPICILVKYKLLPRIDYVRSEHCVRRSCSWFYVHLDLFCSNWY